MKWRKLSTFTILIELDWIRNSYFEFENMQNSYRQQSSKIIKPNVWNRKVKTTTNSQTLTFAVVEAKVKITENVNVLHAFAYWIIIIIIMINDNHSAMKTEWLQPSRQQILFFFSSSFIRTWPWSRFKRRQEVKLCDELTSNEFEVRFSVVDAIQFERKWDARARWNGDKTANCAAINERKFVRRANADRKWPSRG